MVRVDEHHDHLMGEEVASSAPQASRCRPSRAVARVVPQRAAEQTSRAPMLPAPCGPLAVARELLRTPPDPAASPDILRQWHDDIDRLISLAQATLGSTGAGSGQHHRQGGALASVRSPTVGSTRTADLRAELNHRRAVEDAHVSMERARECRLNIQGRNLDTDLSSAAPKTLGHAQIPEARAGCVALADHLRATV